MRRFLNERLKNTIINQLNSSNMNKQKEAYLSPQIEMIRMENEGVIALSSATGNSPGIGGGGTIRSSSNASSYSSTSDLEEMVNDILTFEQ